MFLREFSCSSVSSLNISAFDMWVPYKVAPCRKEHLLEHYAVESNEGKFTEIMNDCFVNMTEILDNSCANGEDSLNDLNEGPCSRVIRYFESHYSILNINGSIDSTIKFSFRKATVEDMLELLKNLDPRKASPEKSIPPKY